MEKTVYFIHINGQQKGPLYREQLREEGLQADTMVWKEGMQDWAPASAFPELAVILNATGYAQSPQPQYTEPPMDSYNSPNPQYPYGQQRPYGYTQNPNPYQQRRVNVDPYGNPGNLYAGDGSLPPGWRSWLGWAIVATIFGLGWGLIGAAPGIVGIVYANRANTMARMGDPRAAVENSTAKTWTIVGLILAALALLVLLGLIFFYFILITGASMSY